MSNTNTIPDTQNTTQDQEDEELLVVFNNEDVKEGLQGCKNSLIGRLMTEKSINSAWIQSAMQNIWKKPEGLRIVELKPKIYQIFFQKETDLDRVLKGSPWNFRNSWFLLKKWDRSEDPVEKGLDKADIKVQIWNLPKHCKTARLGWKIASALGVVKECDVFENTRDQVRFIKAIVTLNTNKPILKGANIGSKEDGLIWTDFKYEKLPNFCYYCGLIGHEKSNCQQAIDDEEKGENKSKELGPWLKADLIGSIVKVVKNQQNGDSEERKEKNTMSQQRLTARMLEKLEKLTMIDIPEPSNSKGKEAEQLQYNQEQRVGIEQEETEEIPLTLVKQVSNTPRTMATGSVPEKAEQKESTENIEEEAKRKETKKKEIKEQEREFTPIVLEEVTSTKTAKETTKQGNKTWKRQARQMAATTKNEKENSDFGRQKRKALEAEEMEIDSTEVKMIKINAEPILLTAEAAQQPCRRP
ncbi:uncharacterized protein LOC107483660 [Arachis duranensis]|uniref:Uncharacterized protein LOC107483660 n=1 Tax=Arachis duranensis TaxID=130453 RepID=A0A6P4D5S2_ARADU|nr:uncharacterized protein LOC107483660 [Arachis duranensis]